LSLFGGPPTFASFCVAIPNSLVKFERTILLLAPATFFLRPPSGVRATLTLNRRVMTCIPTNSLSFIATMDFGSSPRSLTLRSLSNMASSRGFRGFSLLLSPEEFGPGSQPHPCRTRTLVTLREGSVVLMMTMVAPYGCVETAWACCVALISFADSFGLSRSNFSRFVRPFLFGGKAVSSVTSLSRDSLLSPSPLVCVFSQSIHLLLSTNLFRPPVPRELFSPLDEEILLEGDSPIWLQFHPSPFQCLPSMVKRSASLCPRVPIIRGGGWGGSPVVSPAPFLDVGGEIPSQYQPPPPHGPFLYLLPKPSFTSVRQVNAPFYIRRVSPHQYAVPSFVFSP